MMEHLLIALLGFVIGAVTVLVFVGPYLREISDGFKELCDLLRWRRGE